MDQREYRSGFVAILGRPNVGKSTLMNAMIGEKIAIVSQKPQTTRNRIMGVLSGDGWQIVFLDTPGLHKPRTELGKYMVKSAQDAMEGVDLVLVMVDASAVGPEDRQIVRTIKGGTAKRILVLNKIDLIDDATLLRTIASLKDEGYDEVVPVSAMGGKGMAELQKVLVESLPKGPQYFPEDMVTDQPERQICAEIIREKALRHLKDEVPHGIGVEMMRIEAVSDKLTEIHATLYCEKPSHKGIIIGKAGSMLRTIGQESRADIERLLGVRINLQLWVKVREDWRNRASDLRTLGYDI